MGPASLKMAGRGVCAAAMFVVIAAPAYADTAPGAPGAPPTWSYGAKTGIGTSYEAYDHLRYADAGATGVVSRVWFSVSQGIVTEVMSGQIHDAQLKDLQLAVVAGGHVETESADTIHSISYLDHDAKGRPLSLAYRLTNRATSGRYETVKDVFTDPDGQALFIRVTVRALKGRITPYLLVNPQIAGTGVGDRAEVTESALHAWEGDTHMVVRLSRRLESASAGFAGRSDGLSQLRATRRVTAYASTGATPGHVALTGRMASISAGQSVTYDVVLGFGANRAAAQAQADAALHRGYGEVLARYNGTGARTGWEDYLGSLTQLPRLAAQSGDGGRLVYASAMVLKAQEDKTHAGALIASLSAPWGDTASASVPATGYKAVWPRDFYQIASALLALGDTQTPAAALDYLHTVQVRPDTPGNHGVSGWFLQKSHVDGTPEWIAVQLDQTAMPIMLADKLWRAGVISNARVAELYPAMIRPAADFLVSGGQVGFQDNSALIQPPRTQQERWEEQPGYSPSTTAAVVTGLIAAADLAEQAGDGAAADRYRAQADSVSSGIESRMVTSNGALGRGRYYLRLSVNGDPNSHTPLESRNGQPSLPQDDYLDAGFLELVRYGVRPPMDSSVRDTLTVLDDMGLSESLRVKYEFHFKGERGVFPGWRRYGGDGYGEDTANGANYATGPLPGHMSSTQRGRVWPLLTGERGHYELAAAGAEPGGVRAADIARIRGVYVRAMELFANSGLMIPEQVFDGVGAAGPNRLTAGQGTGSATPLAWAHAEYVKLLRSLADGGVWDRYDQVARRYGSEPRRP